MTIQDIKPICKSGKWGIIPGWKGYIKYNYYTNELEFVNGNYILSQGELENKINDRNDLYYII